MKKENGAVSATRESIRAEMLEEIRQELATMTEEERVKLLLELRKVFDKEQKEKLLNKAISKD